MRAITVFQKGYSVLMSKKRLFHLENSGHLSVLYCACMKCQFKPTNLGLLAVVASGLTVTSGEYESTLNDSKLLNC